MYAGWVFTEHAWVYKTIVLKYKNGEFLQIYISVKK